MADLSVVLAGGGTAGHVNPLLATAAELCRTERDTRVLVLGTAEGLEADLVPAAGLGLTVIPKVPLPRRPSTEWLAFPGRWRAAVRTAADALDAADADVVVGFGGYVATPAYMAARRRGVPIVVHEQNARPGLANRVGARFAAAVGVTFPDTPLPGATLVGLPLRPAIADLVAARATDAPGAARHGARSLGLDPDRTTVLVTGGSLGALRLNTAVPQVAAQFVASGAQVLHLTGRGKSAGVTEALADAGDDVRAHYHVREYLSEMEDALACTDLVIARSGAGTVSELSALGIPAVYVPLPVGNGEQRLNAAATVAAGGGILIPDADLTAQWLTERVLPLVADAERLTEMGRRAASVGVRDGATRLADLVRGAARRDARGSAA
ncbi:undecaprenyldiphospho-muramoylpentapeptide beta-N-acetylglucosaminyltransferase [Occultella glacieicola]|uniref:UDP-N-acetylglucosamine--N-acetylmuramyl-(pentapeptide) pyrophosphoryl-undecaprenol N-acetylglucosamine transferase n=1 Tax=Occultella glacieicola TaxID=2518684 RepID=A0ABY2E555_9MICO|nr:undecaprenyldiphospho-muramoylpentapeptide beta-N-acetylglucosaminyltransferase [Occultella glacieicola]TDE90821.1 undecaprenyldiphospho-muramoylpentapeptide beta-N-acetylglucosaminyltransferase [Occultella glacieicola]